MPRILIAPALLLIVLSSAAKAQQATLPGCEPPPAVHKIIKDQLEGPAFDHLTYAAQIERKQQVLSKLIEHYPREVEPYREWIDAARDDRMLHPDLLAGLQKDYRARAAAHPDDPLALYIAANSLQGTDTPETIRLLERAQSLAPGFPWPALDLADMYTRGKFEDKAKFTDQLNRFWTACPVSQNAYARGLLVKVPALQPQVAKSLRAELSRTTDPKRLKDYGFLWGLEFRTTPPQKFPELRQQIVEDVKRLERVKHPHPDAEWANLTIRGAKQAQVPDEDIKAKEDALIAAYPHSEQAGGIVRKRWEKEHPEPTDQKDAAAWKVYNKANWAAVRQWMQQYPDSYFPVGVYRFYYTPDEDVTNEPEGIALVDTFISDAATHYPPSFQGYTNFQSASYLLNHKWAPEKALGYIQQTFVWNAREQADYDAEDNHSDQDRKDQASEAAKETRYYDSLLLLAALRAHQPDAVASLKASIEAPRAADDKDESGYWLRRARLAATESHQQDALGYYQLALRTRPKPPTYERGKLTDDLGDEAHALWTERGGTEVAWAAFSQPGTTPNAAKADDARWEKPTKALPDFQLADLSGKTWTVKNLNGKVVLINLWATWCGPCNAELPQLQKLYEQAKGRSDLQILTFNIDEDLGLVQPFMKEKGYTFPVVPAYSYVVSLLDGYAIPQNWVLNPKGDWEWTQIGYGSDDAWVKDMLAKLDAVKGGS